MGRERKLTPAQIAAVVEAFSRNAKSSNLAKQFGVSIRTIQRALLMEGRQRKRGRRPNEHFGKLAVYVREHPEETFPRSLRAIAERTRSTPGAVKAFLYRRRKALADKARNIDFASQRWKYKDTKGRTIPAKAISSYTAKIESWSNIVRLECTLKGEAGRATIRLPWGLIARLSSTG